MRYLQIDFFICTGIVGESFGTDFAYSFGCVSEGDAFFNSANVNVERFVSGSVPSPFKRQRFAFWTGHIQDEVP